MEAEKLTLDLPIGAFALSAETRKWKPKPALPGRLTCRRDAGAHALYRPSPNIVLYAKLQNYNKLNFSYICAFSGCIILR